MSSIIILCPTYVGPINYSMQMKRYDTNQSCSLCYYHNCTVNALTGDYAYRWIEINKREEQISHSKPSNNNDKWIVRVAHWIAY